MHVRGESAVRRLAKEVPVAYIAFDLLWLDGHSLFDLHLRASGASCSRPSSSRASAGGRPSTSSATARRCSPRASTQGLEGVVAKRLDSPYEPGRRVGVLAEGQERPPRGRRHRRLGAGERQAHRPHRGAARRRRGGRRAALRGPRRHRVHGGRARPPRDACSSAARTRRSPIAATARSRRASAVFVEPTPGRGGRVHGVDERRRPARTRPTRGCARRRRRSAFAGRRQAASATASRCASADRTLKLTNLDKVLYPAVGFTKRDIIEYLVARGARAAPAPRGPAADAQALPQRRRRQVLLREADARATGPTGSRSRRSSCRRRPSSSRSATTCRRSSGSATSPTLELHTSLSRARADRAPDGDGLRPGSRPAGDDRRVLPGRADPAGDVREPRPEGVPEDLGHQGHAGLRPAQHARRDVRGRRRASPSAVAETLEAGEPDLVVSRMAKAVRGGKVLID